MYPFQSMNSVSIYIAITVILLLVCLLRMNPLRVAGTFVLTMFRNRTYLFHLVAVLTILYLNKFQLALENSWQFPYDFTSFIFELEGSISAFFQHAFEHRWVTFLFSYFYVMVFPSLMIVSVLLYVYTQKKYLFHATCYAIMINYLVAIPFYLFFPVNEVWYHLQPDVRLLIVDVFPTFEQAYRPLSGLNNCFPSLHTSLSVTLAILAYRSEIKPWRIFAICSAIVIIVSIFYLGIHWVVDMIAGTILGIFAAHWGYKLAHRNPYSSPKNNYS